MEEKKEKIKKMKTILLEQVELLKGSDEYLNFLKFSKNFRQYSFFNRCFIHRQNQNATFVQGFRSWQKINRIVKKGEKGIGIFVPMFFKKEKISEEKEKNSEDYNVLFSIGHVFDISQTEGDPVPEICKPLSSSHDDHEKMLQKILQNPDLNIFEEKISLNGYFDPATDKIYINSGNNATMKIKTICNEIAHRLLSHSTKTDIELRETQAEACAFLACSLLDIDSSEYSNGYIAQYSQNLKKSDLLNYFKQVDETVLRIVDCFN